MRDEKIAAAVWTCSVSGPVTHADIPPGGDLPMRQAVRAAYRAVTGQEETRLSSGWGEVRQPADARPDSLDAAWAEAEALVPNGHRIYLTWPLTLRDGPPENLYHASCRKDSDYLGYIGHNPGGPTPAAALRALAAKLREVGR